MENNKIPAAPAVQTLGVNIIPEPFIDEADENTTYYGYAPMGTDENAEGWMIVKKVKSGTVTKALYAQGKMDYVSAWSNRTSYNYSR